MSKRYSILALVLPALPLILGNSCARPVPVWSGKIYAGSSADEGMVRRQGNEVIRADSPQFDDMMGMKWKGPGGFEGFVDTYINGCEQWKQGVELAPMYQMIEKLDPKRREADADAP